ncbi:MAG: CotH kinase family protein [Bacteroidales bacterium]|nr:CotH kinase family protein [Bacteroidales bacterium]MDY5442454.1 CotH kinase family protein [Candidatus Cryptobacteroides sp.]
MTGKTFDGAALALLSVIAGAMMASCADIAEKEIIGRDTFITAVIDDGGAETRTCIDPTVYRDGVTGLLWSPKDSIGVFSESGTENARFVSNSDANVKNAVFAGTMSAVPEYAYYPYTAENYGLAPTELKGVVGNVQNYDIVGKVLSCDWKYGSRKSDNSSEEGYRFTMKQLFSMGKLSFSADGSEFAGQNLHSVRMQVVAADGSVRRINGQFTFDATTGSYTMTGDPQDGTDNVITLEMEGSPALSAGRSYTAYITLIPDVKEGDALVLTFNLSDYSVEFKVKFQRDLQQGFIYDFPMSFTSLAAKMAEQFGETPKVTSLPKLSALKFTVSDNAGKLLDKQLVTTASSSSYSSSFKTVTEHAATIEGNNVSLVIPYLYNFNLVPQFTATAGAEVAVDGTVLESGKTEVDWAHASCLTVTKDGLTRTYDIAIRNTGLPVVVIEQSGSGDFSEKKVGGTNIFGSIIGGTVVNKFVDFWVRGKDTEWVADDKMTVYNADGSVDMATTNCGVRLRGNSTQKLPKKPFAVKLTAKRPILGMPTHKRWCLLANWLDRSMIRNLVGFAAAKATTEAWKAESIDEGMVWNPSGKSVELVIDGRHVGNYLLCEQIKIGSKRLNINDCYEDLVADGLSSSFEDCGYLVEFDVMQDENYKGVTSRGITWQLKDDVLPADYASQIGAKIQAIEDAIKKGDFAAYSKLIDIPSFIDQWFVVELAMNREYTEPRSLYSYYNGGNDKLHAGPVWDFDRGTFQNPTEAQKMGSSRVKSYDAFLSSSSKVSKSGGYKENQQPCLWYPLLMNDPEFVRMVKSRWSALYPYLLAVTDEIVRLGAENALSWEYDSTMWPGTAKALNAGYPSGFSDFAGDENLTSYEAVIQNLIGCYLARLDGMNTLITSATAEGGFAVSETTF